MTSLPTIALKQSPLASQRATALRVAIISDFAEEQWFSMDLVAEMLTQYLRRDHGTSVTATRVCPTFVRCLSYAPVVRSSWFAFAAERFVNRFCNYPRWLHKHKNEFDVFHIVDHSYSHLVHHLPANRTIVTCHDLDAFRCVLEPAKQPRSALVRWAVGRMLDGLRKAARVSCVSRATRDQVLAYGLVPEYRTEVVSNGVHPACSALPDPRADTQAAGLLGPPDPDRIELLHVGSTIPRKRVDLLLRIFGSLRHSFPNARLVQAGGAFTAAQHDLIREMKLDGRVSVLPFLNPRVLAAVYRRAAVLLITSEAEGFGLPVIEAMACGTPVVASDCPSLKEVGGGAACYCPNGNLEAWATTVACLLRERSADPKRWSERRAMGESWAANFSWQDYAGKTAQLYKQLVA